MLDIKFVRENPDLVKENIRKKFQNAKLPLVDEAIALDSERRQAIADGEALKAERNKLSKANGPLYGQLKKCADEAQKAALQAQYRHCRRCSQATRRHHRRQQFNCHEKSSHIAVNHYKTIKNNEWRQQYRKGENPDRQCPAGEMSIVQRHHAILTRERNAQVHILRP